MDIGEQFRLRVCETISFLADEKKTILSDVRLLWEGFVTPRVFYASRRNLHFWTLTNRNTNTNDSVRHYPQPFPLYMKWPKIFSGISEKPDEFSPQKIPNNYENNSPMSNNYTRYVYRDNSKKSIIFFENFTTSCKW